MGRSARGLDWLNKFPTQEQLDNLDPRPPFDKEPIPVIPKVELLKKQKSGK